MCTAAITACQACPTAIPGYYWVEGVIDFTADKTRVSCFGHHCGQPDPWTTRRIEAARALADEIDGLGENDKLLLKASIDDLVKDPPITQVASVRFKKLGSRGGKQVVDGMRDILVDLVNETVRKGIWG